MRRRLTKLGIALALACAVQAVTVGQEAKKPPQSRFQTVNLYLDSGDAKLAAYQVDVRYDGKRVKIVGIEGGEGGEGDGFADAPRYDRAGLEGGRIVLAAFTAADKDAPAGRTRVATLHLYVEGEGAPDINVRLVVAAAPGGEKIQSKVTLETQQEDKKP